ncbi:MAG TPA: hypothetical protein VKS80_10170, partial [Trinickia sp.]|nr:hypothetical protein [Trinickia sp.]
VKEDIAGVALPAVDGVVSVPRLRLKRGLFLACRMRHFRRNSLQPAPSSQPTPQNVTRLYRRPPRNESKLARTPLSSLVRYAPNLRVADRHVTMRGENGTPPESGRGPPASSSRFGRAQQEAPAVLAKQ